jgi:hypothetical protein
MLTSARIPNRCSTRTSISKLTNPVNPIAAAAYEKAIKKGQSSEWFFIGMNEFQQPKVNSCKSQNMTT